MRPSTRNKSKETLLKTTLKKQLGSDPSSSRLRTRSSKSKSFANTEVQHDTHSDDTDSDTGSKSSRRKSPTQQNRTCPDTDSDTGSKSSRRKSTTSQNRTCPAVASKDSPSHSMSAALAVVSTDDEEDVVSATDVRTAVKNAVTSKRRKSMLPNNANKENIDANNIEEASPTANKYDTRKSIDHVTKRKNLNTTINNYTPEELKKACLNADDAITELQMKYQSLLTIMKESELKSESSIDAQRRGRDLQNQRDELEHKNEIYEKVTRKEDQLKIQALESDNIEKRHKIEEQCKEISHLRKHNTELEENVISLSAQIDVLQQTQRVQQDLEKKSDQEILILQKENINHTEEIQHLNRTLNELRDQVEALEELNNKLLEDKESLEQRLKDQDKERTNLLDQMHKEIGEREAWKIELVSRTEDMESQLNHLEDVKCRLEGKVSSLVKENEEYEGANRRLKEYQLKLEESNQKTLQEFEKNLGFQEQDVLTLLVPHMQTDSPTYFFVQDTVKTWIKNCNDEPKLMALYKELICNLQDVTDFYSLLCGVSIWKVEEDTESIDRYHCQLNPVLGCGNYRFVMKVHAEEGMVSYCPEAVDIETLKNQLPKGLVTPTTFQSDRLFVFLRNILEHLGQVS